MAEHIEYDSAGYPHKVKQPAPIGEPHDVCTTAREWLQQKFGKLALSGNYAWNAVVSYMEQYHEDRVAEKIAACANCGKLLSLAKKVISLPLYDGEAVCSQFCLEEYERLGCPLEHSRDGWRDAEWHAHAAPTDAQRIAELEQELTTLRQKVVEQGVKTVVRRSGSWTHCAVCGYTLSAPEGVRNVTLGHASDCLVRDVMEEARP